MAKKTTNKGLGETVLAKDVITIPADYDQPYMVIPFNVPAGAKKVGARTVYPRTQSFPWIYVSLFDPDGFRGSQLMYIREGDCAYDLWVAPTESARGCIPGAVKSGEWCMQLDITQMKQTVDFRYEIYYETEAAETTNPEPLFDRRVLRKAPDWYQGELHAHTTESDGTLTVQELLDYAVESDLDFLAITDHFTISQWWRMKEEELPDVTLINSCEITSQYGHANIHGITEWVDVFIDRADYSANQAAAEVHRQGGLFCINHVMSSLLGWRHHDFDWDKADLFEIYHRLEGPNNIPQISFWDTLLREGHRLIGVAGTDSHSKEVETHKMGRARTWVYAEELSQEGILAGLKNGNVYASLGPRLAFSVENSQGDCAHMGGKVPADGKAAKLSAAVTADRKLMVTFIKNGLFLHAAYFDPQQGSEQVISFVDRELIPGYYRVELHDVVHNSDYRGIEWRDFTTVQALGNPVWIT